MQTNRFLSISLLMLTMLQQDTAIADQTASGFIQYDYIADRPETGGNTGNAHGYDVTAAYQLPGNLTAFGEYEHLPHPLQSPPFGFRDEDDYETGLKFLYPVNATVRWLTELAYAEEHDGSATGTNVERGYDIAQGLRIAATTNLELVADLHHETVGVVTNAAVLGFVQGFSPRFALECVIEHSYSQSRYDNALYLGFRVYY